MPTILRIDAYRFFFYSNENNEPMHIHIQKGSALAKFWLQPVTLASSSGFPAHELSRLSKIVQEYIAVFTEAWNDFFSTSD